MTPDELNRRMIILSGWINHNDGWVPPDTKSRIINGKICYSEWYAKPPQIIDDLNAAVNLAVKLEYLPAIDWKKESVEVELHTFSNGRWRYKGEGKQPYKDHASPSAAAAYALCSAIDKAKGK